MTAHTLTYPALQRRLISTRRGRALFLSTSTQHVRSRRATATAIEIVRALAALLAVAAWSVSLLLIGG